MKYRFTSRGDLNIGQTVETYKNFITGGTYDTKSTDFSSKILVSPGADLVVSGNRLDRTITGIPGFGADKRLQSKVALNFKEREGISYGYTYDFSDSQTPSDELTRHDAAATVSYLINSDLSLRGNLNYSVADYFIKATEERQNLETGGAQTGVAYRKIHTPDFLGPFVMDTNYGFNTGYSKVTGQVSEDTGGGLYYENTAGLLFTSKGWTKDRLSAGYNISSKRDRSPLSNNARRENFRFDASTFRIPQTTVQANISYSSIENSSAANYSELIYGYQKNPIAERRDLTYQVTALYLVSPSLNIDVGASKQRTSDAASLSTLQPTNAAMIEQLAYIGAHYVNAISRSLVYRADVRDEFRSTSGERIERRNVEMNLDYRIRQVLVNFKYRWNASMPDNGLTTYVQSYYVKLSRPF